MSCKMKFSYCIFIFTLILSDCLAGNNDHEASTSGTKGVPHKENHENDSRSSSLRIDSGISSVDHGRETPTHNEEHVQDPHQLEHRIHPSILTGEEPHPQTHNEGHAQGSHPEENRHPSTPGRESTDPTEHHHTDNKNDEQKKPSSLKKFAGYLKKPTEFFKKKKNPKTNEPLQPVQPHPSGVPYITYTGPGHVTYHDPRQFQEYPTHYQSPSSYHTGVTYNTPYNYYHYGGYVPSKTVITLTPISQAHANNPSRLGTFQTAPSTPTSASPPGTPKHQTQGTQNPFSQHTEIPGTPNRHEVGSSSQNNHESVPYAYPPEPVNQNTPFHGYHPQVISNTAQFLPSISNGEFPSTFASHESPQYPMNHHIVETHVYKHDPVTGLFSKIHSGWNIGVHPVGR